MTVSTVPTPPATLPESESEWRFHETGYPSEWVEAYRPGSLHPVNLGDSFKDGQYRVIRKLGYGSFSTVWLARDTLSVMTDDPRKVRFDILIYMVYSNLRYVALKVMDAKAPLKTEAELSILERITECRSKDPPAQHILLTLDMFQHSGPNGTHLCLVSEPMGPPVASLAEDLVPFEEWVVTSDIRYPKRMGKRILQHTLRGLKFLLKNGIVHADLQPGNLLPAIYDIDSVSEEDLQQDLSGRERNPEPELVRRLDGAEDRWAPRYLYIGQSLVNYTKLDGEMLIKLSDFGAAFWAQDPPTSTVTPVALRSPELVLGDKIDSKIDIWSFGCLIFELLTGFPLFCVMAISEDHQERIDDDHLLQMNDMLEPLPDIWLKEKWPRAKNYFGPNRERLGPFADDQETPYIDEPLEVRFQEHKPDNIDDVEAGVITSLIRSILKYEPSQRPTAEELLKHPWFQE